VAELTKVYGKVAAFRMDVAANLLQAPARGAGGWGVVIKVEAGKTWHQAVLRTISGMSLAEQGRLKALVDWVQDYEMGAAPAAALRPVPVGVIPAKLPEREPLLLPSEEEFTRYDDEAVSMALMSVEKFEPMRQRAQ